MVHVSQVGQWLTWANDAQGSSLGVSGQELLDGIILDEWQAQNFYM